MFVSAAPLSSTLFPSYRLPKNPVQHLAAEEPKNVPKGAVRHQKIDKRKMNFEPKSIVTQTQLQMNDSIAPGQ